MLQEMPVMSSGGGGISGPLVGQVPVMTSDTSPSGTCTATQDNANAYKAFDGDYTTYWTGGQNNFPLYIGYGFGSAKTIKAVNVHTPAYGITYDIVGKNDGGSWTSIVSNIQQDASTELMIFLNGSPSYSWYGLKLTASTNNWGTIHEIQFFE